MITYNFEGKTAVVTGGGRGIGKAAAFAFAEAGANVAILSRTLHDDLVGEMAPFGDRMTFIESDVSDAASVRSAMDTVTDSYGAIDILLNNVSISSGGLVEEITEAEWDAVMNVNVKSYFLCINAVIAGMKERGYGKIINISSVAGRDKSMLLGAAYSTSKAAVIGLTRQVASEAAKSGVNVNCICPSQTYTPMLHDVFEKNPELEDMIKNKNPSGYIAEPKQITDVVLFLASEESSYMKGAIVDVNGGLL